MGKSHQAIATQMGLRKPSVFMYIRDRGGIEPRKRTRSEIVLSDVEREEISRGLRAGLSLREIARDLGVELINRQSRSWTARGSVRVPSGGG